MFENLRKAFQEAVSNFKEELGREDVPEVMDRLLRGMYEEITDSKAYIGKLEDEIELTIRKVERESNEAATARRRERQAREISDEETARIASEYAQKHERSREVLQEKADALGKELEVRKAEVSEMLVKFKEAKGDRQRLAATAGRSQTRDTLGGVDDLFAEMDRMEAKIEGREYEAAAAEEMYESVGRTDPDLAGRFEELESDAERMTVEEKLEELKRRMGKS
jgi:phage shock protein A